MSVSLPDTALAANQGTTRALSSPLPKGSETPKDKEGTRRNSKFSKFCSYEITFLDLKGRAGQSPLGLRGGARDWSAAATSHQESGNLPRFWESLLLFCVALSRTKKAKKRNKREIALRVGMNHSSQKWQNPPHLTPRHRSSISFQSGLQSSGEQGPLL